jgi:hypothetical protein
MQTMLANWHQAGWPFRVCSMCMAETVCATIKDKFSISKS